MDKAELNRINARKGGLIGGAIAKQRAQKAREDYAKNPKLCLHCGKPLPYYEHKRKKFCSRSCSTTYSNLKRCSEEVKKLNYCKNCGKEITKRRNESWVTYQKKDFCCMNCKKKYTNDTYIKDWKEGRISGMCGDDLSDRIRDYLLNKVGYKCPKCGWHEVNPQTGRVPLEVHHIDGDPYNNKEDNLEVLCPNCHSLTNNFKVNRGNGRYLRRKSYAERKIKLKELEENLDKPD